MAIYSGTDGNDALAGSAGDDLFQPLLGADTVIRGAGFDTLLVDWSAILANGGTGTITAAEGVLSGSLMAGSGTTSLLFEGVEAITATLSAGSDRIAIDAAALAAATTLSINGGGGHDLLQADFSAFANTTFALGVNFLITANHGSWAGFEQFDLTLGTGTNVITLQDGADTVRSTGGVDTLDLGAGRDLWLADFSGWTASFSFGWDGDRNLAAVSNGTYVQRVEGGAIRGGSGDDAFFLSGANGFAVEGGAGRDLLVWDEAGLMTAPYSATFIAGAGGTFEGWVRTATFSGIEQANVALSDADNTAYVDTAPLALGATMNLDGGAGSDVLEVDFSAFASTSFAIDESGTAQTSHGTYSGFEHFGMALGAGTNSIATGAGEDTIYSLGGVDWIDGGAGFDFWGGDYSEHPAPLVFTWDSASGALSNGTVLAGIEAGYIIGSAGADHFTLAGPAVFDVFGGAGSDTLVRVDPGLSGANTQSILFAAPGSFWGFIGNGQVDGIEHLAITFGSGNDTIRIDAAPLAEGATLAVDGGAGVDALLLDLSALADTVFSLGLSGTVSGNRGTYSGFETYAIGLGGGTNAVTLGNGNDTVMALFGGSNTLALGPGDDEAWGGSGAETVDGGAGTDRFIVAGTAAAHAISRDGLGGYWLTDLASGMVDRLSGIEQVVFADVTAELPAYPAGLNLLGTSGADMLIGSAGADTLRGLAGNDSLSGGGGDDRLNGGAGNDTITGGAGIDTLTYEDAGAGVKVNLSITGKSQTTGGSGSDWLGDSLENLAGSAFADTLTGNALANIIIGLAGNDVINGGAGADTLIGGTGNDSYTVDNAGDQVIEAAGEGTDKITARIDWTLAPNVENLTLAAGTAALRGTGNDLANVLIGNAAANRLEGLAGNDRLDGGAGVDTLVGGLGNDTYVIDNAGDLPIEAAGEGTDLVTASVSFTLGDNIEKLTLTGTKAIDGTGNAGANLITGNAAANLLSGLAGNDTLNGGGGDDTLAGGAGADILSGGAGADAFRFDLLEAGTKDTIRDFAHGQDRLEFVRSAYPALAVLPAGELDPSLLALGPAAATAGHRLVYNQATGALFIDGDGAGGAAQVQIALLSTKPLLDAADIVLL